MHERVVDDIIEENIKHINKLADLPKQHKLAMQYCKDDRIIYIVTQHVMNGIYTLFSVDEDNKLTKIKTANTPTDFKEVYP